MLVTNGGKQAVYQTFATLLDPGDEVILPAPYWTTYPEAIRLGRRRAGRRARRRDAGLPGHRRAARGRAHRRGPRCCCSARRPTRPARSTRREQVRAIGQWALEHGIWVVTDEIYEHLTYAGDATFSSIVGRGARARRHLRRAQRGGQDVRHDGLAGRLDDRPDGRDQGRHQPAVARDLQRLQRVATGGHRGRLRRPERGRADARGVRPAAADDRGDAQRRHRLRLPGAEGRVLRVPVGQGRARPRDRRVAPRRRPPSSPRSSSTRPRWRSCPARRSGAPATCGCRTPSATTTWPKASRRIQKLLA